VDGPAPLADWALKLPDVWSGRLDVWLAAWLDADNAAADNASADAVPSTAARVSDLQKELRTAAWRRASRFVSNLPSLAACGALGAKQMLLRFVPELFIIIYLRLRTAELLANAHGDAMPAMSAVHGEGTEPGLSRCRDCPAHSPGEYFGRVGCPKP
jgi:hypothetical protein